MISNAGGFEIRCRGRSDTRSELFGIFNETEKKRLVLPMPAMGWRIAILTFVTTKEEYNIVVDGVKEQPLVRASTALPQGSRRFTYRQDDYRPSSATPRKKYQEWI